MEIPEWLVQGVTAAFCWVVVPIVILLVPTFVALVSFCAVTGRPL